MQCCIEDFHEGHSQTLPLGDGRVIRTARFCVASVFVCYCSQWFFLLHIAVEVLLCTVTELFVRDETLLALPFIFFGKIVVIVKLNLGPAMLRSVLKAHIVTVSA